MLSHCFFPNASGSAIGQMSPFRALSTELVRELLGFGRSPIDSYNDRTKRHRTAREGIRASISV